MATIDSAGNHHHGKGTPDGGKFAAKGNSAPAGGLDDPLPPVSFTPEDVRNPDFTAETVAAHFGVEVARQGELEDATPCYVFARTFDVYRPLTNQYRMGVSEDGEITSLETMHGEHWFQTDHDDRTLHELRHQVNLQRLAFAGVLTNPTDNDGGYYGQRFTGGRATEDVNDATEIAKRVRADIKKAQEYGALPDSFKYSVTRDKFAGGQAVRVQVDGVPDAKQFRTEELDPGVPRRVRTQWASELHRTLSVIGNQWQDSENDPMIDYFDNKYFFSVETPDEHSQAFWERERQRQKEKRQARKNKQ